MDRYFKKMDSLESSLEQASERTPNSYFKPAGDLSVDEDKKSRDMSTYFKPMDNLVDTNDRGKINYFKPAGDLNVDNNDKTKLDEINDYLITVVSGKKYPPVCELGVLMGAGIMVVNLEQLKELVESGHNIVSAKVINADREMIEVEIQRYEYDKDMMERRSRF